MVQLILGTAQLGLDYGINNQLGKPDLESSFEILDYAYKNGICLLDTASAYGNSENIIGNYIKTTGNEFTVATKLSSLDNGGDIFDFVNSQIDSSVDALSKEKIDLYLIHNFKDLIDNEDLIKILKNSDKILKIGVSLYEPSELEYILSSYSGEIDFVQIPFNILDSRWIKNDLLNKTKCNGMEIFVRSIFVQGLIFLSDENEMNRIDSSLKKYITFINSLANEKGISVSRLAMDYVKSYDEIDGILVGCETVEQLQENIIQFNTKCSINDADKKKILDFTNDIPKIIVDPRKW